MFSSRGLNCCLHPFIPPIQPKSSLLSAHKQITFLVRPWRNAPPCRSLSLFLSGLLFPSSFIPRIIGSKSSESTTVFRTTARQLSGAPPLHSVKPTSTSTSDKDQRRDSTKDEAQGATTVATRKPIQWRDDSISSASDVQKTSSAALPPISLADSAAKKLRELFVGDERQSCLQGTSAAQIPSLRVRVVSGGCAGFQYEFGLMRDDASIRPEHDVTINDRGCRLIVDRASLEFLNGCVVEYEDELLQSRFVVSSNKNASDTCSCGVSFDVASGF